MAEKLAAASGGLRAGPARGLASGRLTRRSLILGSAPLIACALAPPRAAAQILAPTIERIGNPFASVWPNQPYPRNIWDMQVFDGALFLGAGNADNSGPSPNAGPVPVIRLKDGVFEPVYVLDEEQVDTFRVQDGELVIPGSDAREGWELGNYYRFDGRTWSKLRVIPNAIHVLDVRRTPYGLLAIGVSQGPGIPAWSSTDEGRTWSPVPLADAPNLQMADNPAGAFTVVPSGRLLSTIQLGGEVYVSGVVGLTYGAADKPARAVASLLRLTADLRLEPVTVVTLKGDKFDRVGVALFPTVDEFSEIGPGFVGLSVGTADITYYLGIKAVDESVAGKRMGVFAATGLSDIARAPSPPDVMMMDLVLVDQRAYALANTKLRDDRYTVTVFQIGDGGGSVTEVLSFEAPTLARSFEYFQGAWHFGMGTTVERLAPEAGEVWRVRDGAAPM